MRDNPFHSFVLFLTGQLPDQISAGGMRWVTVAMYWVLLVLGLWIAVFNWRKDREQRTFHHASVAALRFLFAGFWYTGSLWKLPLPVSLGFADWMEKTVKSSSFAWHSAMMRFFLDHVTIVGPLVYMLEVGLAATLMLGLMNRLTNIVGALFVTNLLIGLFNEPSEWVWTYVGLICTQFMFAAAQSGRSLGFDNIVAKRLIGFTAQNTPLVKALRLVS